MKIQKEDNYFPAKESDLRKHQTCQHVDVGLLAFRIVRKQIIAVVWVSFFVFVFLKKAKELLEITREQH